MIIGILGGGQLGRMLALAGYRLGFRFRLLDPSPDAPAGQVAECVSAKYDDLAVLDRCFRDAEVVTYDSENVPVDAARHLARRVPVHPRPEALEATQDRLHEKRMFQQLGIHTPRFAPVGNQSDLATALRQLSFPCVLKTRRFGYDGKGQFVLRKVEDVDEAWRLLGRVPLLLEEFVRWDREVSLIAVRSREGKIAFYPLAENHHDQGILRLTLAPAPALTADLQTQAEAYASRILEHLDYVGVLAMEFFQQGSTLLANETAPRVHNSGHWTIEGAETSQFENHLRAIAGLPLGPTAALGHAGMINLIGRLPPLADVLAVPGACVHVYGKAARPGRKLGHVTLRHTDAAALGSRLAHLRSCLSEPASGPAEFGCMTGATSKGTLMHQTHPSDSGWTSDSLVNRFRILDISEPVAVLLASFESPGDLEAIFKELRPLPSARVLLVIHLPSRLGREELLGLLDHATTRAARVVLAGPHGNATVSEKLRQVTEQQRWPCPVQFEPDADRAVVGAMQSLRADDTVALLWPDEPGLPDPSCLVALGARWRAAWEAPEDGEFHWLPPEPGDPMRQ